MTPALLILLLVSGDATSILVDPDVCHRTVASVRAGERVTLEDEQGKQHEVEMAMCIEDDKQWGSAGS